MRIIPLFYSAVLLASCVGKKDSPQNNIVIKQSDTITNFTSAKYLGAEYKSDPLGENKGYDKDPLIRFDAFDCTTFVETVIAQGNQEKLNKIRYKDGNIDFESRNHFIEYDWVNNNKDLVENVSDFYGDVKYKKFTINKEKWFKKSHGLDAKHSNIYSEIKYIPYSGMFKKIETDKELVVLFIVEDEKINKKIGTQLSVSHMGLLLPGGVLRHASSEYNKVVDVDFWDYVQKRKVYKKNLGIALYKIK